MRLGQQHNGTVATRVRRGAHRQHVCRFDDEMFARMRSKAVRGGVSLSEAIRKLVERRLEVEDGRP